MEHHRGEQKLPDTVSACKNGMGEGLSPFTPHTMVPIGIGPCHWLGMVLQNLFLNVTGGYPQGKCNVLLGP